jgi:hypothetical protein
MIKSTYLNNCNILYYIMKNIKAEVHGKVLVEAIGRKLMVFGGMEHRTNNI